VAEGDKIIIRGRLVSPGRLTCAGWLELQGGVIRQVGFDHVIPPDAGQVFDFGENYVCPGFIDLHVHGGAGYDVMDGSREALEAVARFHARGGTAAFLGTTMSTAAPRLKKALVAAAEYCSRRNRTGARMLGIHMEGPYLNPVKKGAHTPAGLKLPDTGELEELLADTGDVVKMVTLAPELPGSLDLIKLLTRQGVRTAVGHSVAGNDELAAAAAAGLSHGTHMFNAMGGFHHRDPGTAGYLLQMPEITVDVIADGLHVHPAAISMLIKLKGMDKVVLITDAIRAAGLSDGCYDLGGQDVSVQAGEARLAADTLAGSTLTMNRAISFMVRSVGVSMEQAVQMASLNPARALGMGNRYGRLEKGYKAGITVIDRDFNVAATFVEGEKVL
jgi:N-acetylglucosamine-6-phosphate deacetylase